MLKRILTAAAALILAVMGVCGLLIQGDEVSRSVMPLPEDEAAATENASENAAPRRNKSETYIINENTGKFHYEYCSGVKDIHPENKREYNGSRDDLVAAGFSPCSRCNP